MNPKMQRKNGFLYMDNFLGSSEAYTNIARNKRIFLRGELQRYKVNDFMKLVVGRGIPNVQPKSNIKD